MPPYDLVFQHQTPVGAFEGFFKVKAEDVGRDTLSKFGANRRLIWVSTSHSISTPSSLMSITLNPNLKLSKIPSCICGLGGVDIGEIPHGCACLNLSESSPLCRTSRMFNAHPRGSDTSIACSYCLRAFPYLAEGLL